MISKPNARAARLRRRRRIRARLQGVAERPRLSVFRSSAHIYAQIIDDERGHTLVAASSIEPVVRAVPVETTETDGTKRGRAEQVGQLIAQRALEKGITKVAFDRGGFVYHGRVRALADAARAAGLNF